MVILKSLKYYDKIVNYIGKNDYITSKIIDFYRDFVLCNKKSRSRMISLDKVVYSYLYNDKFMNYIKEEIKKEEENIDKIFFYDIEDNLKKLYREFNKNDYKEDTRWL